MSDPVWLTADITIDVHSEQLNIFGGPSGIRDIGMLESALGRPLNKFAYGDDDLSSLAAAYAFGIAKNHPFIDGNKRAAFASMVVFLGLNEIEFIAPDIQATAIILSLAAGEVSEETLACWIRDNWRN